MASGWTGLSASEEAQLPVRLVVLALACQFLGLDVEFRGHAVAAPGEEALAGAGADAVDDRRAALALREHGLVVHDGGRDEEDDLVAFGDVVVSAERRPDPREVPEERNLATGRGGGLAEEPAEDDRLAVTDDDVGDEFVGDLVGDRDGLPAGVLDVADLGFRDLRLEFHADLAVVAHEGTEVQLRTSIEELHGLGRRGVGGRRADVTDLAADEDAAGHAVQSEQLGVAEDRGVGDLIEDTDEGRDVAPGDAELQGVGAACATDTADQAHALAVSGGGGVGGVGLQGIDDLKWCGEVGEVDVADEGEVDAERVLLVEAGLEDRGLDQDLGGGRVELGETREDLVHVLLEVGDEQGRAVGEVLAARRAVERAEGLDLAVGLDGALLAEEGGDEVGGIDRAEIVQADDLAGHDLVGLLDLGEFLEGVDVDEVALLDVAEAVGVQDGVEGLAEADVVKIGGDASGDVLARDDVALVLEREHLEDVAEVFVVDVEINKSVLTEVRALDALSGGGGNAGGVAARRRILREEGGGGAGECRESERRDDRSTGHATSRVIKAIVRALLRCHGNLPI